MSKALVTVKVFPWAKAAGLKILKRQSSMEKYTGVKILTSGVHSWSLTKQWGDLLGLMNFAV